MRRVRVPLGNRSYEILIGGGLLREIGAHCRKLGLGSRCAIITDSRVESLYASAVENSLSAAGFSPVRIVIPEGEKSKSLKIAGVCFEQLAAHRLERKSFVIALGGGVVGDLAGFVAASYLRGIPFVQVPTSLLAQVDSSVGGKVGINLPAGKNLVGAFHQPRLVVCDLDTLQSLPDREFRSGLAEVVKYGIIYDLRLFERLEKRAKAILEKNSVELAHLVARSCAIKGEVVGQDETESGLRAILNFGHTIGHAIENVSGYGKFLHGEAISIGQVAAAFLSSELSTLGVDEVERIWMLFKKLGLPVSFHWTPALAERLFEAMRVDKKVSAGEIRFVLAERIGSVKWGCQVPEDSVRAALEFMHG